jgi:hypothetical protein
MSCLVFDQACPTADEQPRSVIPAEDERRFTHIKGSLQRPVFYKRQYLSVLGSFA